MILRVVLFQVRGKYWRDSQKTVVGVLVPSLKVCSITSIPHNNIFQKHVKQKYENPTKNPIELQCKVNKKKTEYHKVKMLILFISLYQQTFNTHKYHYIATVHSQVLYTTLPHKLYIDSERIQKTTRRTKQPLRISFCLTRTHPQTKTDSNQKMLSYNLGSYNSRQNLLKNVRYRRFLEATALKK